MRIEPAAPNRRRLHTRRGLTFVELMLALAITAMVGLGVSTVMFAVASSTNGRNDIHTLLVRHKLIDGRLGGLLRSCKMVLAKGNNYLVLWVYDTNGNDVPNRDEIRYVEYNSVTGEIWSYKTVWTAGMTQAQINAANTDYALATDFGTVIPALKGQATFPGERWLDGISTFAVAINNIDPQSATLVSYSLTLAQTNASEPVIGATSLRNWTINVGGGN